MRVSLRVRRARLKHPFGAAWGSTRERELLLLALEDSDGRVGLGEAAPLPDYDGVSLSDVRAALSDCHAALARSRGVEREELLAECARLTVVPQALAAIDLALWDLAGRRAAEPVWRLLGASAPGPIPVNYTIAAPDRAGAAREAAHARAAGYRCVKLKVGTGDEAGRVAAVRAVAGPEMAIRLDANGAWSTDEATAALRALAPAGLELCEEPVTGLEAVLTLAGRTQVPIALDESSAEPGALQRRHCQAVCLKLGRCGGISGLVSSARQAREAGYEVYLASALDGPLGIAAALHAAAAIRPDRPCGLATLELFEHRPRELAASGGEMWAPSGAGLGGELAAWYGED